MIGEDDPVGAPPIQSRDVWLPISGVQVAPSTFAGLEEEIWPTVV